MTDQVLVAVQDGVMTLTFNRPDKKNAINDAMYGVLADGLARAETDPAIRVVLFNSNGDSFTSGNDLADFQAANAGAAPAGIGGERNVGRFLKALARAEKPLVAAVRGLGVGVGTTMLLHCDLVYIAETAKLTVPFVNLALVPEAASSLTLPSRIGHARAYAMFALGEAVDGKTAAAWGIANAALPEDQVDARALHAAQTLAMRPLGALTLTKRLMRDADQLAGRMDEEGAHFAARLKTAEATEALTAFRERRPADFSKVG
ncbi:MAG: enoyl-CoA hydratase-related protein [Pseudomonadota bacterium]